MTEVAIRRRRLGLLAAALVLAGCAHRDAQEGAGQAPAQEEPAYIACDGPRPEMCTFEYRPVCGIRADFVRCVKEPCLAALPRTYGNACAACADPAVSRYSVGECQP